jgi:hypothetical protein
MFVNNKNRIPKKILNIPIGSGSDKTMMAKNEKMNTSHPIDPFQKQSVAKRDRKNLIRTFSPPM